MNDKIKVYNFYSDSCNCTASVRACTINDALKMVDSDVIASISALFIYSLEEYKD